MSGIKQYAYTGDVKLLKTIGCKFQKLFAANYKTYQRDDIFMFVVSGMVLEFHRVQPANQAGLVKFVLDNLDQPETFWYDSGGVSKWAVTNHGNVYDLHTCFSLEIEIKKELYDKIGDEYKDCYEEMREREGGTECTLIDITMVKFIRDLNSLKPLELIESK